MTTDKAGLPQEVVDDIHVLAELARQSMAEAKRQREEKEQDDGDKERFATVIVGLWIMLGLSLGLAWIAAERGWFGPGIGW